jgi:hypothetical protein
VAEPDIATSNFAVSIVTDYIDWYQDNHLNPTVTQTAYDLSRIMDLLEPLDALARYSILNMDAMRQAIWSASIESTEFHGGTLRDIGHFCKELSQASNDTNAKAAANAVVEAHRVGEGCALIAEAHSGLKVKNCHGATVYLPLEKVSRYYEDLDFVRDIRWLDMLRTYFPPL